MRSAPFDDSEDQMLNMLHVSISGPALPVGATLGILQVDREGLSD